MRRIGSLVLFAAVILALLPVGAAHAKAPLVGATVHTFDGSEFREVDGVLYLRAWVGEIDVDGDAAFDYDITWWIALPLREAGVTTHYTMVVEIHEGETLLLATQEHGTTTTANSTWRANGVVTEAYGALEEWQGRRVHESGSFWPDDGSLAGESIFRLN
jgi:hypothetical protein